MLCARTESGETICLPSYTREQLLHMRATSTYYCPTCNERLIVKVGEEMTPHFAHRPESLCSGGGGEGVIHERGKSLLYMWLKRQFSQVQLEAYIPEIQQRPDILVTIGQQKVVLEFQYSPMSIALLRKRTIMYQANNYYPIWILDRRHLQQRSTHQFVMNAFVKQCLFQRSPHSTPLLFFFCTKTEQITVLHHILFTSLTVAFAQTYTYSLQRANLNALVQPKNMQTNALFHLWKRHKRSFRLNRRHATGKQQDWLEWLYKRGLPIDYLPSVVHLPVKGQLFMNVQPWNWQSRLWYFLHYERTSQQTFMLADCIHVVERFMYPANHYPLLHNGPSPVAAYIHWLILLGYVKRIDIKKFHLHRPIPPLHHIEEAIKQDEHMIDRMQSVTLGH